MGIGGTKTLAKTAQKWKAQTEGVVDLRAPTEWSGYCGECLLKSFEHGERANEPKLHSQHGPTLAGESLVAKRHR